MLEVVGRPFELAPGVELDQDVPSCATRDRDFADVWTLSRTLTVSAATVRTTIVEVTEHRGHDVVRGVKPGVATADL